MSKPKNTTAEIGGHTYSIEYVKDLRMDGDKIWGRYSVGEGRIQIEAGLSKRASQQTLIHEITHVILEQAGYGTHALNEGIAEALGYGLTSVKVNGKKIIRE